MPTCLRYGSQTESNSDICTPLADTFRIFCYDYWASCLSKCRTKGPFATVKRTDSTTMLHNGNRGESSESGDIVRQIVLHGGNNKNM